MSTRKLKPPPINPAELPPIDTYAELARVREAAIHGRVSPVDAIRLVMKVEELKTQIFEAIQVGRVPHG